MAAIFAYCEALAYQHGDQHLSDWLRNLMDDQHSKELLLDGEDMLYMIVEHFKNRDPIPVYRRFRDRGRLAPEGLQYVSSWVDEKLERCFQLMETADRTLLDAWITKWSDLADFEVYPVMSSQEAAEKVAPHL